MNDISREKDPSNSKDERDLLERVARRIIRAGSPYRYLLRTTSAVSVESASRREPCSIREKIADSDSSSPQKPVVIGSSSKRCPEDKYHSQKIHTRD